ncbi:MAG TPA: hypothetical protein VHJ79_13920 [Mycobacterium sp.]|jgi:hypothetical protein|nr:hypothetical protein [Mycobacterium sp.]
MTEAMTAAAAGGAGEGDTRGGGDTDCWCCGQRYPNERLVRLGNHPEAAVCVWCAHFLHQQAMQREDALRPSIASRLRDGQRWARRVVMDHHWHRWPVIGRPLRWLGRYLP